MDTIFAKESLNLINDHTQPKYITSEAISQILVRVSSKKHLTRHETLHRQHKLFRFSLCGSKVMRNRALDEHYEEIRDIMVSSHKNVHMITAVKFHKAFRTSSTHYFHPYQENLYVSRSEKYWVHGIQKTQRELNLIQLCIMGWEVVATLFQSSLELPSKSEPTTTAFCFYEQSYDYEPPEVLHYVPLLPF